MLTTEEIILAASPDVMLAKNRIIQAMYDMFGRLADTYRSVAALLPGMLTRQHPKIAKGENYLGLPWVMLDYPRNFGSPDIFAIRTQFWWGHYFSLQVLLQGTYLPMLQVTEMMNADSRNEWFFCTGSGPWQHHFEADYMMPIAMLTPEIVQQQKAEKGFFKIGVKLPVVEWEVAETFLAGRFEEAVKFLRL